MNECVFCDLITNGEAHEVSAGIYRIEPLNPVTKGHMLFVSSVHTRNASESPAITGLIFAAAAQWAYGTQYNLITSSGEYATQTILHTHIHLVPRRKDDGLKLPWTGQVKEQL